ncbi:hypothetical protein [Borrelia crocidurae]|uniref:Putative lipoprotein n=1 Tax=Borrelia crocidurae (strain Achema) TaxID=1155096 RepID=I0FE62_BORCA|nr:hypothetical protein [Borrelia crocidurae]AFI31768.1 Putative lipoprotein [Borrelia crocidurae str. Achema]
MKFICMVISITFGVLLFTGCDAKGPLGRMGLAGSDGSDGKPGKTGRGDLAILYMNFFNLYRSYNANREKFDPEVNNFDAEAFFSHSVFKDEFSGSNVEQRNDFYASLKYNIEDIKVVEKVVEILVANKNEIMRSNALFLLNVLVDSAQHVKSVLSALEPNLDVLNEIDDVAGISDLNIMLMMMWTGREKIIDDIRFLFSILKKHISVENLNMRNIVNSLNVIITSSGDIYKQVNLGVDSLFSLKEAILNKIKNLTRRV